MLLGQDIAQVQGMGPPLAQQLVYVAASGELLLRILFHVDNLDIVLAVPTKFVVFPAAQLKALPVALGQVVLALESGHLLSSTQNGHVKAAIKVLGP